MQDDCCYRPANESNALPSFISWGSLADGKRGTTGMGRTLLKFLLSLVAACVAASCGSEAPAPKQPEPAAEEKPATPAVPEDIQSAAQSLLGGETQVLLFGDLAKTGKQQFLAANVVPKTSKNNNIVGTIITRAVIGEDQDGKWTEIFRCDDYLKNAKGFLALTPLTQTTAWRIAYEQDPVRGLVLYLTPLQGGVDTHSLPIGIRWNPSTKRYQSLDSKYERFLLESPSLGGHAPSSKLQ